MSQKPLTPAQVAALDRAHEARRGVRQPESETRLRRWHVSMGHAVTDPTEAEAKVIAKARAAKAKRAAKGK